MTTKPKKETAAERKARIAAVDKIISARSDKRNREAAYERAGFTACS